jgi:D-alanyl-D-alanine carboxypeptidase
MPSTRPLTSVNTSFRAWAVVLILVTLAVATTTWVLGFDQSAQPTANATPIGSPRSAATPELTGHAFDRASSYEVVVDKERPLEPLDYAPKDLVAVRVPFVGDAPLLRPKAATAVEALFAAFRAQTGLQMQSNSAYRSYAAQVREFDAFSSELGTSAALESAARPGYSEHQTGLAIDIGAYHSSCTARACFAATPQSQWLASNAWRFGFIIRYPRGEQSLTGFDYEPWHIRYVGTSLARKIHGHYPTLEAYFHLPAAPNY